MEKLIIELASYAVGKQLSYPDDFGYFVNKLAKYLDYEIKDDLKMDLNVRAVEDIVFDILSEYKKNNHLEGYQEEAFVSTLMDIFIDKPSTIVSNFNRIYNEEGPVAATSWFYKFSKDTFYIKEAANSKNVSFTKTINSHDLIVTINLAKPEKDPKDIERAKLEKTSYPKCALCKENVGFFGSAAKASKTNLRIIPNFLNGKRWYFQYSPYSYYNEHAILLSSEHQDMSINEETIKNLMAFVDKYNHYFIGSNADLPIVGGSILNHEHYQAGRFEMPIFSATTRREFGINGLTVKYLNWPLTTLRIKTKDKEKLVETANLIISKWRSYQDLDAMIVNSDLEVHNTVTPILRFTSEFELDIILRNNLTTDEHPLGLYHPHQKYHAIKKENIGLIEAMGLAILPPRLKGDLALIKEYLLSGNGYEEISHYSYFIDRFKENNLTYNQDNLDDLLEEHLALFFYEILVCSGVYKQDEKGDNDIEKFIDFVNEKND